MRIAILGYRDWAFRLSLLVVGKLPRHAIQWHTELPLSQFDAVFAVGWSKIIPQDFYQNVPTFVLHPSPLPTYRGGSPIQNQILQGEKVSAVSIFKLSDEYSDVDAGPIAWQMPYSLEGELAEILRRLEFIGAEGVASVIRALARNELVLLPQMKTADSDVVWPRRNPKDSEITSEELSNASGLYLANKVRALQDPYPRPWIRTADGGKLYILKAEYEAPE